jgi:hypothetical protein
VCGICPVVISSSRSMVSATIASGVISGDAVFRLEMQSRAYPLARLPRPARRPRRNVHET